MHKYAKLALFPTILLLLTACANKGIGGGDATPTPAPTPNPFGLSSEVIATADHPVAITFAPDGRIFFAEKFTGVIRVIDTEGQLQEEPFADLDVAEWLGLDWGLTGMAVHPDFESEPYLYVFYTEPVNRDPERPIAKPVLARIDASGEVAGNVEMLISDFPETQLDHQGFKTNGSIHFGPDGFLYLSMGDYDYGKNDGPNGGGPPAQDLAEPIGKILRLNDDGSPAPGNPFEDDDADPRVFAFGFARSSDFALDAASESLYNSDATDSCEELNLVEPGGNYSWPDVGEFPFSDCTAGPGIPGFYFLAKPGMEPGQFQSNVGVSGMAYLGGDKYPQLGNGLVTCEKDTKALRRLVISDGEVTDNAIAIGNCEGSVAVAADGTVYFSSATEVHRLVQGEAPTNAATSPSPSP
jgi:glucose/arabinose dehydrogenase